MNPSAWLVRFAPLLPERGAVLDVACGRGRNARFLLDRGHRVAAIDRDISLLGDIADRDGLDAVHADLEDGSPWPLPGRRFDAVVVTNYLHRPLFSHLLDAVAPGGLLLYETFGRGNEAFGRPSNPDFLLEAGELLTLVTGQFRVIAYECGKVAQPRPAVVQRICAAREPCGQPVLP